MALDSQVTWDHQVTDWILDLIADAEHAEKQAAAGPFYPDRGITRESLLAYAADCRRQATDPDRTLREALKGT